MLATNLILCANALLAIEHDFVSACKNDVEHAIGPLRISILAIFCKGITAQFSQNFCKMAHILRLDSIDFRDNLLGDAMIPKVAVVAENMGQHNMLFIKAFLKV